MPAIPVPHRMTIGPVNRCIYCGATGVELTDEHIVPKGIGGRLELLQSSCVPCQRKIQPMEDELMNVPFERPPLGAPITCEARANVAGQSQFGTRQRTKFCRFLSRTFPCIIRLPSSFLVPRCCFLGNRRICRCCVTGRSFMPIPKPFAMQSSRSSVSSFQISCNFHSHDYLQGFLQKLRMPTRPLDTSMGTALIFSRICTSSPAAIRLSQAEHFIGNAPTSLETPPGGGHFTTLVVIPPDRKTHLGCEIRLLRLHHALDLSRSSGSVEIVDSRRRPGSIKKIA